MRALSTALFCLAILASAQLSRASSADPQISIGDPASGTLLTSGVFSFNADANGGGVFNFTNGTNQVWQTLDFFATLPNTDTVSCTSTLYTVCSFTEAQSGSGLAVFDVGFEDPATSPGISPNESFSVDLDTRPGIDAGGWGANNSITGVANFGLPEPASWTLAALGLLGFAGYALYRRTA